MLAWRTQLRRKKKKKREKKKEKGSGFFFKEKEKSKTLRRKARALTQLNQRAQSSHKTSAAPTSDNQRTKRAPLWLGPFCSPSFPPALFCVTVFLIWLPLGNTFLPVLSFFFFWFWLKAVLLVACLRKDSREETLCFL